MNLVISLIIACLLPNTANAHIKWFCAYDTTRPPIPLHDIITSPFLVIAAGFCGLMFSAYLIDDWVTDSRLAALIDGGLTCLRCKIDVIIRAAIGGFFVALWAAGGLILTPELTTPSHTIPWIQLFIAISMLFDTTCVVGCFGILGLYSYGIAHYGAFHMMDYPIFIGLALYVGATSYGKPLLDWRMPMLYTAVVITMIWGALEKFCYPYWTTPLLLQNPSLTMGLPFNRFMDIAGFVEFSLAFFILTGNALARLAALALMALMTVAVPEFGKVDALGHSLFIASFIVMIIMGHHTLRVPRLLLARMHTATHASVMTCGYVATFGVFLAIYYATQHLAGM